MARSSFWVGVAVGATGTALALWAKGQSAQGKMVRVERTVKIDRPAADIFAECAQVERMPELIRNVVTVATDDDISLWIADIEGHRVAWDVELVQVIPNHVIGWTSYRGPKHSGRISFFSIGQETLVQVDMNYAPRTGLARLFEEEIPGDVGELLEAALHDLKASLDVTQQRWTEVPAPPRHDAPAEKATGTYGALRSVTKNEDQPRWNEQNPEDEPS